MYSSKRLDYDKYDNMVEDKAGFPLCMRDSGNRAMDNQSTHVAGRGAARRDKTRKRGRGDQDKDFSRRRPNRQILSPYLHTLT